MKSILKIPRASFRGATLLLWMLAAIHAAAQDAGSVAALKSASNLYDRNGRQAGSSLRTDGFLAVSASSGNVLYSYPISEQSLDGHSIAVSLNYCGSVEHTAFMRYVEPSPGSSSHPYWSRFTQGRPLWLVAVNEFAVQTLSMAGNYHQDPQWNLGDGRTTSLDDRDLVWCVDGYDFGNRMFSFDSPNAAQAMGNRYIDVIRLLRADGSVLELRNVNQPNGTPPAQRPELYTGHYFVNAANHRGFAYVEFDSLNWPEHIRRYSEGLGYQCVPRRVHYYPGDGLEYIFAERVAPYGTLAYSGYNGDTYEGWDTLYGGMRAGPSIFYLETIATGSGATIDVSRIRHHARYENSDRLDSTKGRSFISGITGHRFSFPITFSQNYQEGRNNSMVIEALGRTVTVWFDSVAAGGNGPGKFSLAGAGSWTTSENSLFSWIREQYKSAAGYVTAIADPENRLTTFAYERVPRYYTGYGFAPGHDTVLLKNFRLTEIREPTRTFRIAYQPAAEHIRAGTPCLPAQVNDVVDSVARYDRRNNLLGSDRYAFAYQSVEGEGSGWLIDSSIIVSTDHLTGQHLATIQHYHTYTLPVLLGATAVPQARFTTLYETSLIAAGDTITSFTRYGDSLRDPDAARWGSPYLMLPTATWTTVNGLRKSFVSFLYDVDVVRTFGGNQFLSQNLGRDITAAITRIHRPDDTTRVLLTDSLRYLHLPLADTSFTRYDTVWDERGSFARYHDSYWRTTTDLDQSIREYWEEAAFDPQVFVKRIDTLQGPRKVPPLFALPVRRTLYDSSGTLLRGRIWSYAADAAQRQASRGSLLADSIIGAQGDGIIPGINIEYDRWLGKNLPSSVTNANGARIGSFYDYDSPLLGDPSGTIVRNDDEAADRARLAGVYFAHRFERPLAWQRYVRRYGESSEPAMDTITTLVKRSFFGLAGGTVDANGWYSRTEYDRAARPKKVWLPFDFPQDSSGLVYSGAESIPLYGATWHVMQRDSVECFNGSKFIYPRTPDTTVYSDSLFAAMRSIAADPPCPPCNSSEDGEKESDRSLLTTCNFGRLHTSRDQYIGVIDHIVDSSSALFNAASIDSAWLQLYATSLAGECVVLTVSIPQFGFSRSYSFNCGAVAFLDDDPQDGNEAKRKGREPASATPPPGHAMYHLKVNLAPVIGDLMSLGYNDRLGIHLTVATPDARADFVNGENAADTRPRLVLKGSFNRTRFQPGFGEDYTLAWDYHDDSLYTTVRAKVDDPRHTSSDPGDGDGPGRYTETRTFYGAGYAVHRAETTIGPPDAPLRVDSVMVEHTGWNRPAGITDQEGERSLARYDALGRQVLLKHADGAAVATEYTTGTPAACGIGDTLQDFFGFCSAIVTMDENGVRHAAYYDAFNRLRRSVADSAGLAPATLYDYDAAGRLARVVMPDGGVITYRHDRFGRLRRATHPDQGTTSFAYDNVGNLRFAQDAQQAGQGLLTYFQYDDLNRPTLVGEAAIDEQGTCDPYNEDALFEGGTCGSGGDGGPRLTDRADASRLRIEGGGDVLTANPTLFAPDAPPAPLFPDPETYALKNCPLDAEPRLHESSPPARPLIRHLVGRYASQGTPRAKLDDFEDLRLYPEFARMAVYYDALPPAQGPVWGAFPDSARWNRIAPKGTVRNLKGRRAAIAYRERSSEPYHFVTFSYDERGRVEAVLRYNENLGMDAVYYTYTSANGVASVTVADPLRQHTTWYGYDANGRLDTVWTRLTGPGSGLVANGDFSRFRAPVIEPRPSAPDIVYSYTRRSQVERMEYPAIGMQVEYAYNRRAFLDSLVASVSRHPLPPQEMFAQKLEYSPAGEVLRQTYGRYGARAEQDYAYDDLGRLREWTDGSLTTTYEYDQLGNRLLRAESGRTPEYLDYHPGTSRIWSRWRRDAAGNDTIHGYGFNADGAQTSHVLSYNTSTETRILREENLRYSFRNLLNRGRVRDIADGDGRWYDWRYRYSPGGEREQKRLYDVSGGVVPAPDSVVRPWAYYVLGAGGAQLAVYHGQEFDSLSVRCADNGRRVYMYPAGYRTFGLGPAAAIVTRPDGRKEYQVVDHLGTPRMTLDGTAGMLAAADYGPFGEEQAVAGVPQRAGYIDRERDLETDLANFGVRAYDPDRGAFTSPEPLWPAMPGVSPYAYVGNDPLGYTDRSGLSGESPQSTPLEPASSGSGDVEQGLRWWQIERLLGNSGPDDGRLGQRKPKRKRDRVVMGPPSPPKGDRGAKVVPPPIIVEAPSHTAVSAFTVGIVGLGIVMRASGAMTAVEVTSGASVALAADDVTGIGVADDILIPVVAAIGAATVVYLLTSYALSEGGDLPDPPIPDNPAEAPGPEWVWKGSGPPESGKGNWHNEETGESLHPDLKHPLPKGPHWDYWDSDGNKWARYPDGRIELVKQKR